VGSTKLIENEQGGIQRLGRYDLIAEIAAGGMATVYLARLGGVGGFQRNVAIKCLHPHLARNEEFVEMFLDEARLAALIHHPNVVPIQEVGEGSNGYYLVMDYVEGDTFASLLSRAAVAGREVPRDISVRIIVDMLAGLHAAHELRDDHGIPIGLVHRDVSPQNVLVGTDGITRITDFGVARAASRLSATRAGQLKGKLAYMAPEQANGDEEVDRRADVFSSGVVLWEAMALKRLFKASNEAATLNRVLNDRVVSPREFSELVPEEVAQVCLKALNRDLNVRYVSCAEFGDALERAGTAAGCLATGREVATYVNEVVGASLESHRQAIREWLERRASEPPTPSAIHTPFTSYVPPPPPGRRPSLTGLNDTSAITQASGVTRGSLRPLPPSAGVLQGRVASHAILGSTASIPPSSPSLPVPPPPPPPPSGISPVASVAPAQDVHPTLVTVGIPRPQKRRWPVIAGGAGLFGVAVIIGVVALSSDPDPAPVAAAASSLPSATASAPAPAAEVPRAAPSATAVSASEEAPANEDEGAAKAEEAHSKTDELAKAEAERGVADEPSPPAKGHKPAVRTKYRGSSRKSAPSVPTKKKSTLAGVDLDNPYK